ncbi:MAG: DNA methyltransferase [Bacillota bacterium]|nr:DNA methyltransferase [Bacillota bacterium]
MVKACGEYLEYLETINGACDFEAALALLDRVPWDFKDFPTQYLSHKFHSYPARFIPQIPLTFIKLFTGEGDLVCDPFCGCGTTLVESFLNGRNSIGNDLNPLAVLISKAKTTLLPEAELSFLTEKLAEFQEHRNRGGGAGEGGEGVTGGGRAGKTGGSEAGSSAGDAEGSAGERVTGGSSAGESTLQPLPRRKLSRLFDAATVRRLEGVRLFVRELLTGGSQDLYDLGRVALSAAVWSLVENEEGKNCKNRQGENGSENCGGGRVEDLFLRKLALMRAELERMTALIPKPPGVRLLNGDARRLEIRGGTVDLIVTSPPYVNALDYYRVHMYNMLWLGLDFGLFKQHEIGGHSQFIANRFRLLARYLGDMLRALCEMHRVLKKGKLCVVVVGNSSLEYELIETHKFLAALAARAGFAHLKSIFRNIDVTRKYTNVEVGKIEDEYILVFQKLNEDGARAGDEEFIMDAVREQMERFGAQIARVQGTSVRGRRPGRQRLSKNIEKIGEAIRLVPRDVKVAPFT